VESRICLSEFRGNSPRAGTCSGHPVRERRQFRYSLPARAGADADPQSGREHSHLHATTRIRSKLPHFWRSVATQPSPSFIQSRGRHGCAVGLWTFGFPMRRPHRNRNITHRSWDNLNLRGAALVQTSSVPRLTMSCWLVPAKSDRDWQGIVAMSPFSASKLDRHRHANSTNRESFRARASAYAASAARRILCRWPELPRNRPHLSSNLQRPGRP
jgi:hypothetical protein